MFSTITLLSHKLCATYVRGRAWRGHDYTRSMYAHRCLGRPLCKQQRVRTGPFGPCDQTNKRTSASQPIQACFNIAVHGGLVVGCRYAALDAYCLLLILDGMTARASTVGAGIGPLAATTHGYPSWVRDLVTEDSVLLTSASGHSAAPPAHNFVSAPVPNARGTKVPKHKKSAAADEGVL